jgi:hypothetical protein
MWGCGGDVLPFWALSRRYFLPHELHVLVVTLFSSQRSWIPTASGSSCNSWSLLDVLHRLDVVAVSTLFSAWSWRKFIGLVVFSALTLLGNEVQL